MTYTQALHDAMRVSLALRCRVAVLYGGADHSWDWCQERNGFYVPPDWEIVSVIDRGQLEGRD